MPKRKTSTAEFFKIIHEHIPTLRKQIAAWELILMTAPLLQKERKALVNARIAATNLLESLEDVLKLEGFIE